MGCLSCLGLPNIGKASKKKEVKICRVCELTANDTSTKECTYCYLCNAWICDACMPNVFKRGWAAFIEMFEKKDK